MLPLMSRVCMSTMIHMSLMFSVTFKCFLYCKQWIFPGEVFCWNRREVNTLPVITVPTSRKTQRKTFPAKVPHLSIIFPSAMVKMIPKTWNKIQWPNQHDIFYILSNMFVNVSMLTMLTLSDLCWTVEQSRWCPLWLWISELNSKFKAQRQISCHKKTADRHK